MIRKLVVARATRHAHRPGARSRTAASACCCWATASVRTCRPKPIDCGRSLKSTRMIVLSDFAAQENLQAVTADLAVVLGGDGSILHAVRQMGSDPASDLGCESREVGVSGGSGSRRFRARVSRRVCREMLDCGPS